LSAEERQQEAAWTSPSPSELHALLADRRRRLVRNARELSDLIVDALREVARSVPQHGQLLWDMGRVFQQTTGPDVGTHHAAESTASARRGQYQVLWRPKDEYALSAYLKEHLELRLASSAVVVNATSLSARPTRVVPATGSTCWSRQPRFPVSHPLPRPLQGRSSML
jgi:hypothetical protein